MIRSVALLVCFVLTAAGPSTAVLAQTIDLALDLVFSNPSDDQSGGTFRLAALSGGGGGIAGLVTRIDDIQSATLVSPGTFGWMDPIPTSGGPVPPIFARDSDTTEIALLQDNSLGAASLIYNIGGGAGTPGDQGSDPFGMGFDNAALLVTGTFAPGGIPSFTVGTGLQTEGNVFSAVGNIAAIAASVNLMVRDNLGAVLVGDYNRNGVVDAADYVVWRKTLGQSVPGGSGADGDNNGIIEQNDYSVWRANFGAQSGTASVTTAAVPEPASWLLMSLCVLVSGLARGGRVQLRMEPAV